MTIFFTLHNYIGINKEYVFLFKYKKKIQFRKLHIIMLSAISSHYLNQFIDILNIKNKMIYINNYICILYKL